MMSAVNIQDFKAMKLIFSKECTCGHQIFMKEHSVRTKDELKPPGQTLFVVNLPPYTTETGLKNAFSVVGNIKRTIFENNKGEENGFKRAFVVFNKREHLLKALKLKKLEQLTSDIRPVKIGLETCLEKYNNSICDPEELQAEVNAFMLQFKEDKKNKNEEAIDDEGWITVTKAGRRPGLSRKESVANKLQEKTEKNTKKKELKNFYTFQIRESKMKNIANLRKNFEEAKTRVELMKKARKFKPY